MQSWRTSQIWILSRLFAIDTEEYPGLKISGMSCGRWSRINDRRVYDWWTLRWNREHKGSLNMLNTLYKTLPKWNEQSVERGRRLRAILAYIIAKGYLYNSKCSPSTHILLPTKLLANSGICQPKMKSSSNQPLRPHLESNYPQLRGRRLLQCYIIDGVIRVLVERHLRP